MYPTVALDGWITILQKETDAYFLTASSGHANRPVSGGTFNGACCPAVAGTTVLAVNTWTHVAATYDGAQLRFYVNGAEVASTPVTGSYEVNANPLWIGGNAVYGEHFQGRIDDLRIYHRALSQVEIQFDMNTPVGSGPPTPDGTPPSAPTGLTATPVSQTQIDLAWAASTDNVGVTGYQVFRDGLQIATTTAVSDVNTGLTASTLYTYAVRAFDAADNLSVFSASVSATTPSGPPPDPPPTVSLTAPASGSTLRGTATVSATASDNVGVIGVHSLDGMNRCGRHDLP